MFTKDFWLGDNGALARSIRTAAQTAIATITVSTFTPWSVGAWVNVLVLSGVSGLVSVLMSLDRREALFTEPPRALPDRSFEFPALEETSSFEFPDAVGCGSSLR